MTTSPLKVEELTGTALDLAVAMATGWNVTRPQDAQIERDGMHMLCGEASKRHSRYVFSPSTDWHQCGELIDYYQIMLCPEAHLGHEGTEDSQRWYADVYYDGGEQFTTAGRHCDIQSITIRDFIEFFLGLQVLEFSICEHEHLL